MQSMVLVCGCIHVDQVDVLALNEHLCAAGSDGPGGRLLEHRGEQLHTLTEMFHTVNKGPSK